MQLNDTKTAYGWASIVTHWSVAVLILAVVLSGLVLEEMARSPTKGLLVDLHKQTGVLALVLTLWRIGWHQVQATPGAVASASLWTARARNAMHLFLLTASVALPVSGIAMGLYSGRDLVVLGLTIPAQGEIAAIADPAHAVHAIGSKLLLFAIAAHALASLKHHLVDRDATLSRMLGCDVPSP